MANFGMHNPEYYLGNNFEIPNDLFVFDFWDLVSSINSFTSKEF